MCSLLVVARTALASEGGVRLGGVKRPSVLTLFRRERAYLFLKGKHVFQPPVPEGLPSDTPNVRSIGAVTSY